MTAQHPIERHALVVGVHPQRREEYLELHRHVWAQVERTVGDANVTNYSIFIVGNNLFAYYEYLGGDHTADMARIAGDPVTRQSWQRTDPCQVRIVEEWEAGAGWQPIDEVWHLR